MKSRRERQGRALALQADEALLCRKEAETL